MENLEMQGRPSIGVESRKNHSKGIGKIKLALIAAITAVMPNLVACKSDYEKCAGGQGKADKAMLVKKEKTCRQRVNRMKRRDEGDSADALLDDAHRACKILNNVSFNVEARLRAALDTKERKDDSSGANSCRKAIADARERGDLGARLAAEAQASQ